MSATILRFPPDAALIAAEREIREIVDEFGSMIHIDEAAETAFDQREDQLENLIATTPPRTLAGAAAKLRHVLYRAETGFDICCPEGDDLQSLRQVLALLERERRKS